MRSLPCLLLAVSLLLGDAADAAVPVFSPSFGKAEQRAMVDLMREIDKRAANAFRKAEGRKRAALLSRFWDRHCPIFSRLYVDFQLGRRHLNVSSAFYNDASFLAPDYWVYTPPIDQNQLNRALTLCDALLDANNLDAVARLARGYCLLEAGKLDSAEAAFTEARKSLRKEPAVYNGLGLAWVKRPKSQSVARDWFRDALSLDRTYAAASYNLAMSHIATRATDVPYHIRKVTRAFPDHPDVYYKLGVWHEIRSRFDGEFVSDAMDAYVAQTQVNPAHHAAWSNLARMQVETGRYGEAVGICKRVLERAPAYRVRLLPGLMEAYQALGRTAEADSAAMRYVAMLDGPTRKIFEDITPIASRKERAILDTLSGEARTEFVHDFWLRHDPTPGTPANEKRVEHVRRVGNAMLLYSEAVKPWDTRGDVYVRYGDPQHKSRSDNLRFETNPQVVRVRDRLLATLSEEERMEIRQFHRRIRRSSREVEKVVKADGGFRIEVSDFESAEFGMDPGAGDSRLGLPDPNEREYKRGLIEGINDRIAPVDIRGIPLFPVHGNRPWEYWIYTDVGDGIEVVFSAYNQHGGYGFAEPPEMTRKLSRYNQRTFQMRRPDNVFASAIKRQPSLLRMNVAPMPFVYDAADFRGTDGKSLVEVYVGRAQTSADTVHTKVSMILYDRSWNVVAESEAVSKALLSANDSTVALTLGAEVPRGDYILTVQVDDPVTGAMGAQRMGFPVESYPDASLGLSDIVFASAIETVDHPARGGVKMTPHPWRRYAPPDPVIVYYEIYGLTADAFGQTRYRMDYRIEPLDGGTLAARVIRGIGKPLGIDRRETLTISYEQVGNERDEFGYVEVDVTGSAPGAYALTLVVTDMVAGTSSSKKNVFHLERGGQDARVAGDSSGRLSRVPRKAK